MRHGAGECPDLETIAAYLDGRMAEGERAAIAEHLATCETCYFVFSEAAQIKAAAPAPMPAPRWWTRPRVIWPAAAAGLAAAATIALAVSGVFSARPSNGPELQALVAAVGTDRTIEPRLTGGFAYGPVRGAVRSGESAPPVLSPDVRIAAAQIEKEATSRSAHELRLRGIVSLVTGDASGAVTALEEAAA
ncbi:MAG: zf-HC2 domain-containing protein, partial [Vicinamibacterales bacterium]